MRLCHSFWTKPMQVDRWDVRDQLNMNVWLFALSVSFAKKIGATIVLHTDKKGKELLGFLPYDEIYLTLDNLEINPRFWAAGKIFAQEVEPLGSIHIDGDVFLKDKKLLDILNFDEYDLIVQNDENLNESCNYIYHGILTDVIHSLGRRKPKEFDYNYKISINCGLVGFNNIELKDKYINGYKEMLNELICDEEYIKKLENDWNIPDLILEQLWLGNVSKNYKHKRVFNSTLTMCKDAVEIGYTHVIGKSKYNMIDDVKNRLFEIDIDIYNKTKNKLKI